MIKLNHKYTLTIGLLTLSYIISKRIYYTMSTVTISPIECRGLINLIKNDNPKLKYIPAWLILGIIETESHFHRYAHSQAGAIGICQLLPSTYDWLWNLKANRNVQWIEGSIEEPYNNILACMLFLDWLYKRTDDWFTTIESYNMGLQNVRNGKGNKLYLAKVLGNGLTWIV